MGLQMKTACEQCGGPVTSGAEAFICSYECTFCPECAAKLKNACPNCGGELARRPRRKVSGTEAIGVSHID